MYPRAKKTERIRSLFQKVATTNHYEVFFNGFAGLQALRGHIVSKAPLVSNFFVTRDLGLLCNQAQLPGTSFATSQIEGNRMGVVEKFAHTRIFTDTTLTFYVDSDYRVIQFFELWHDFIASGSEGSGELGPNSKDQKAYYHRMRYPSEYKVDTMRIQKFNKDHFRNIEYTFLNCFPTNVSAMPVSYGNNKVLECQVTFAYDRYFFGKINSLKKTGYDLQDMDGAQTHVTHTPNAPGNGNIVAGGSHADGIKLQTVKDQLMDGTIGVEQGNYLSGQDLKHYHKSNHRDLDYNIA